MVNRKLTYIDLFCGAGGLSLGFDMAGFENIFSNDMEPSFCETYKSNFPNHNLVIRNITELSNEEIKKMTKVPIDIVIGGPPCQGFSMAGRIGRCFIDDERNHLFKEFARVVSIVKPRAFLMENVSRLYTHNNGQTRQEIISLFETLGYNVKCKVLNFVNYGVPQHRNRVLFVGILVQTDFEFPEYSVNESEYVSVKETIGNLPKLCSGEKSEVPNHVAMKHGDKMLKKMKYVRDGGNRDDIPESLRPLSGDVRKYIRYASERPSICITGDMRKVFHYDQNRALTVRELARIQTFPDWFEFKGSSISQQQQVGNSVPPRFAKQIAEHLKMYLSC